MFPVLLIYLALWCLLLDQRQCQDMTSFWWQAGTWMGEGDGAGDTTSHLDHPTPSASQLPSLQLCSPTGFTWALAALSSHLWQPHSVTEGNRHLNSSASSSHWVESWGVCFLVSQSAAHRTGSRCHRSSQSVATMLLLAWLSLLPGLTSSHLPSSLQWCFPHLPSKPFAIKSLSQGLLLGVQTVSCSPKWLFF